jgi:hypothetical protein
VGESGGNDYEAVCRTGLRKVVGKNLTCNDGIKQGGVSEYKKREVREETRPTT